MNKEIKRLQNSISALRNGELSNLENQLQAEYNKVFEQDKELKAAIKKAEEGTDYGVDEYGDLHTWIRTDLSEYKEVKEALDAFLSDYCCYSDIKNDAIMFRHGPIDSEIVINNDGDIFNGGKCIIDHEEYGESKRVRNKLIEAWMEEHGYFPGVFYQDHYGNVSHVNTLNK